MESKMAEIKSDQFITELKELILNGNKETVLLMIDDESFKKTLETNSMDLIKVICELLGENKLERKLDFVECCEAVISTVVENGYPQEILLELIEQAECIDDDIFVTLVLPLQRVLLKITEKQSQSLEWVLNTIHRYIYGLPLPEDYKFEKEEQLLMENDDNVIRITRVYEVVLEFYAPFIKKVMNNEESSDKIQLKYILLQSFIHLLGKPVSSIDLTVYKSKSVFRYYVEKIVTWIVWLSGDMLVYLLCVENKDFNDFLVERDKDDHFVNSDLTLLDFLFCDKFPNDALGVLYYMVFFENIESNKLPCIYSAHFMFENCLYFSLVLIEESHSVAQLKGLLLAESLVLRVDDNSISYEALESPIHKQFFEILSKHSVYNEMEKIRKLSVQIIAHSFKKYNCKSKYMILFNLEKYISHSGLLGYLITFIKDIVVSMLNSNSDLYIQNFSGKRLYDLMKKYCKLPNGVETDLIDTADSIISSLNLIRFLVLRDEQNISGIWDYVNELEHVLFTPLRQGLALSRSHYNLKLKELEDHVLNSNKPENTKMSVTVGKEELLGPGSKEQQMSVIYSALNAFDLIESILSRVNECISLRKSQQNCET